MKKSLDDNDLDIETGEPKKKGGRSRVKKETPPATPNPPTPNTVPPSPVTSESGSTMGAGITPAGTPPIAPGPGPTPGIPSVAIAAAAVGASGTTTPVQGPSPAPANIVLKNEPSVTYDWVSDVHIDPLVTFHL